MKGKNHIFESPCASKYSLYRGRCILIEKSSLHFVSGKVCSILMSIHLDLELNFHAVRVRLRTLERSPESATTVLMPVPSRISRCCHFHRYGTTNRFGWPKVIDFSVIDFSLWKTLCLGHVRIRRARSMSYINGRRNPSSCIIHHVWWYQSPNIFYLSRRIWFPLFS